MPLEVEKVPIYWLTSQMSREPWLNSAKWFPTGCGRNPGTCIITCCLSRCVSTGRQIEAQPTSVKHPDNGMHECHLNHEANTATPFLFCSYCITLLHCTGEWRIFFCYFCFCFCLLLFARAIWIIIAFIQSQFTTLLIFCVHNYLRHWNISFLS